MASRSARQLVLALCLLAPALPAQEDAGLFFDAVDVNVVSVEVIVTDADGAPVTGLTLADFEVFEDGERVELSNFYAVEGGEVLPGPGGDGPEVVPFADPRHGATRDLRLVILIDDDNLAPQNRNLIFKNLRRHLEHDLRPGDEVMLVRMDGGIKTIEGFTADTGRLLAGLASMEKNLGRSTRLEAERRMYLHQLRNASLAEAQGEGSADQLNFDAAQETAKRMAGDARVLAERRYQKVRRSCAALARFTDSLAGLPGRKAVLYVSDGLPVRAADGLTQAWLGKYESWIINNNVRELMHEVISLNSLDLDASLEFQELVEHASANRVAFYPIANAGKISSSISAEFAGSGAGGSEIEMAGLEGMSQERSLLEMAAGTGGIAFTRTPNVSRLLGRLSKDFASFYSLGYNSDRAEDGEFHKIEVEVKREKTKVRHLKGFREKDAYARLQDVTLSALHYALADNPLDVRLEAGEPVRGKGGHFQVPVMVQIPFTKLLLVPEGEAHVGRVSLCVVARDDRGGLSKPQRIELPITIPNDQILQAMSGAAAYPFELEMNRGRKTVAVGVRDQLGRSEATVTVDVVVGEEG